MSAADLPLLSIIATLAGVIVAMVDGRRAVGVAAAAAAAGTAPLAAIAGGDEGEVAVLLAGTGVVVAGILAGVAARRLPSRATLDPLIPLSTRPGALFGPRAVRACGAALLLPAASWVSFNIPVGVATAVTGVLFPAVYVGLCGALRIFVARTIEDLAVGAVGIGVAIEAAWIVRGGTGAIPEAAAAAGVAVAAAIVTAWLSGRATTAGGA